MTNIWRAGDRTSKLMLTRHLGGLHFPNIRNYYLTSLLRHAIDWANGTDFFSNSDLERALAHPWHPLLLLHTQVVNPLPFAKACGTLRHYYSVEGGQIKVGAHLSNLQIYASLVSPRVPTGPRQSTGFNNSNRPPWIGGSPLSPHRKQMPNPYGNQRQAVSARFSLLSYLPTVGVLSVKTASLEVTS